MVKKMKKILITGARSGIISDVIEKIKNEYNIYLAVHSESELKIIRKKYKTYNNIKCFKLDLLNKEDIDKVEKIKVDILINNAAIMESGSIIEMPFKNIRENFEVNFFSTLKLTKIVIKKNPKAKVITISSLAGRIPIPFCGAYSASKAALTKILESLSVELKLINKKKQIVIIEPGLYKTGFNEYGFGKKYEFMDIDTFFNEQLKMIKKGENIFLKLFQKKELKSISKKIKKAIEEENPKLYYRAPLFQSIFVKIYNLFHWKMI